MYTYGFLIENSVNSNFNHTELGFMRGLLAGLGIDAVCESAFTGKYTAFTFICSKEAGDMILKCLKAHKVHYKQVKVQLQLD